MTQAAQMINVGSKMIEFAYAALDAEKLRANHSVKRSSSSAWPAFLLEAGEKMQSSSDKNAKRKVFTSAEVNEAWYICELLVAEGHSPAHLQAALLHSRARWSWAKIARTLGLGEWHMARRACHEVLIRLVQRYQLHSQV